MKRSQLNKIIKQTLLELDKNSLKEAEECGMQRCECEAGGVRQSYMCRTISGPQPLNCDCCDGMSNACTCTDMTRPGIQVYGYPLGNQCQRDTRGGEPTMNKPNVPALREAIRYKDDETQMLNEKWWWKALKTGYCCYVQKWYCCIMGIIDLIETYTDVEPPINPITIDDLVQPTFTLSPEEENLLQNGGDEGDGVLRKYRREMNQWMGIIVNNANRRGGQGGPDDMERIDENKMAKTNLTERFQQLAGIKSLYETEDMENSSKKPLNEIELFTLLGSLVGVIGAALGAGHLQDMAEDPAMAEKYPDLKDLFSMLSTIGKDMGKGIKETKELTEGIFAAIGGLVGLLGAAGVTTAIEMALEDPAVAEKYPKMVKVFEFLRKVGGAVGKGIK